MQEGISAVVESRAIFVRTEETDTATAPENMELLVVEQEVRAGGTGHRVALAAILHSAFDVRLRTLAMATSSAAATTLLSALPCP